MVFAGVLVHACLSNYHLFVAYEADSCFLNVVFA